MCMLSVAAQDTPGTQREGRLEPPREMGGHRRLWRKTPLNLDAKE